jgi:hypothetical protein
MAPRIRVGSSYSENGTHRRSSRRKAARQPGAVHAPVSLDGDFRDAEDLGDFRALEAAEEAELDHPVRASVRAFKLYERVVEVDEILVAGDRIPAVDGGETDLVLLSVTNLGDHLKAGGPQ